MIQKASNCNWSILFNPYIKYTERQLILCGAVSLLIGSVLGYLFNARFDGVFDLHFVKNVPQMQPFLDNLTVIVSLFLCLLLVGKLTNKKTRIVDILAISLISRLPIYILVFFNINGLVYEISTSLLQQLGTGNFDIPPVDLLIIIGFTIFSILALVWVCALLYNGFKVATHAKKLKSVLLFIVALIVAEVLSKIIISTF